MFGPLRSRRRKWSRIPIPGFTGAQCRFGLCQGDFIVTATAVDPSILGVRLTTPTNPAAFTQRF